MFTTSTMDEILDTLQAATLRLTSLLLPLERPDATALGHWTIADVAAHLAQEYDRDVQFLEGGGPRIERVEDLSGLNQKELDRDPERDLTTLAARIEAGATDFITRARKLDPDQRVSWYLKTIVPMTPLVLSSAALTEILIHGFDIAKAAGRPWPVGPSEAALPFHGLMALIPNYVDQEAAGDFRACYEIRVRGGSHYRLAFDKGKVLTDQANGRRVDCYISADPMPFLLVGYGRIGVWGPSIKGQILAWGRKPWLALRIPRLLKSP